MEPTRLSRLGLDGILPYAVQIEWLVYGDDALREIQRAWRKFTVLVSKPVDALEVVLDQKSAAEDRELEHRARKRLRKAPFQQDRRRRAGQLLGEILWVVVANLCGLP